MEWLSSRFLLLGQHEWQFVTEKGANYVLGLALNLSFVWGFLRLAEAYWPVFISSHASNLASVYIVFTLLFVWSSHLLNLLVYDAIDWYDLLPQYKIVKVFNKQKQNNLPWGNSQQWVTQRNRAILFNFINIGLISPAMLYLDSHDIKMSMTGPIPSLYQVVMQLFFCMTVENLLFYIIHRAAHNNSWLYRFHKVHHEIAVPCPLATNMFHPLDYFVGVVIPFGVGMKILGSRMHYITYLLWTFWRVCDGYDGHCNYQIPWHPLRVAPFVANAQYHSYHHTHNIGNYGSDLMDTMGASNIDYFRFKPLQDSELHAQAKKCG